MIKYEELPRTHSIEQHSRTRPRSNAFEMAMRRASGFLPAAITVFGLIFLFAPLVVLAVYSFNDSTSTVVWRGFSVRWYAKLFTNRALLGSVQVSVIVSLVSAFISTALGTLTALAVVRFKFPGRETLGTLLIAPLVIPEIVLGVALLVLVVVTRIPLGYVTLVMGHVVVTVPFAILIVRAAVAAFDTRLEEAAQDLGANGLQTFTRVTLPILLPSIGAAFLLTATLSFDNFVCSVFLSGVGTTPLPVRIYSMLKLGITPEINAMGVLLICFNVLVLGLIVGRQVRSAMTKG